MKVKHLLIIVSIVVIFIISVFVGLHNDMKMYVEDKDLKANNRISVMIETEKRSGNYEQYNNSVWPDDNYLFNTELSKCDNNSKLTWNDELRSVSVSGNVSDKCYLYFDLYVLAVIDSLGFNTTENSIQVNVNATVGDNPIVNYIYKLDDNSEIINDTSSYLFQNVTNTKPTISVYAKDKIGKNSKVFKYTLPSLKINEVTSTSSTISINLEKDAGTYDISKVYCSINGTNYYETNGIYTFTDLTENTTYNVKMYAQDINGNNSLLFTRTIKTRSLPTSPNITFDSNYNILLSGSTSEYGDVNYYYSTDNVNFTKGSSINLSSSSKIYAYSEDIYGDRSSIVSKTLTISNPQTGSTSSKYYCSRNGTYQDTSSCSYTYSATASTTYKCTGSLVLIGTGCYQKSTFKASTYSECMSSCGSGAACLSDSGKYRCYNQIKSATGSTSYSCPNGGSNSGSTCYVDYTGTTKYYCSLTNTYYDTQDSATSACNSCSSGTKYNDKCYLLS